MQGLVKKQDKYNKELHNEIYFLMEKFSKNPSNANKYFEEVMVEFDNQKDIARKETAEAVCDKMIGEKWKGHNTGDMSIRVDGYNERVLKEKEIKKQILKEI